MNAISKEKESRTFNKRFYLKKRISAGSFGVVFVCSDVLTQDYAALKIEKDEGDNLMSLDREQQILDALQGVPGVPKLLWYGFEHGYNCMAISLLGRDLSYHLRHFRKFTLKCVCNIADQLLVLLENLHKKNVIHRDIKPENILTGRETEQSVLYFVDFGISKFYKENDGQHISFKDNKPFIGTTRYASISAHKGYELSRRDDLESLGYMLVYLLKGILPWQNIQSSNDKEKTKLVGQMKMSIEHAELCKDLPSEFQRYFDYVKKLTFKGQPDYKYLIQLIHKIAQTNGLIIDRKFDWVEQGTTTTKSIDTARHNSRIQNRPPSQVSNPREKRQTQHKKPSYNDLSGSSLFSQGDFLKPPKKSRAESRHRSVGDSNESSEKDSQQSSVFLNYVPSVYQKGSQSILQSIKARPGFQQHISKGSQKSEQFVQSQSKHSLASASDYNKHHDIFNQQENFQDLEALEELLNKEKVSSPLRNQQSKKNIIVKGVRDNRPIKETTATVNFDDFMDDDPKLTKKIQQLVIPVKHFKQTLSKF